MLLKIGSSEIKISKVNPWFFEELFDHIEHLPCAFVIGAFENITSAMGTVVIFSHK